MLQFLPDGFENGNPEHVLKLDELQISSFIVTSLNFGKSLIMFRNLTPYQSINFTKFFINL